MSTLHHAPTDRRRPRSTVLTLLSATALVGVVSGCSTESASAGAPPGVAKPAAHASYERTRGAGSIHPLAERPGALSGEPPVDTDGASGVAGGELPDGVEPFDDTYPALTRLDPALLGALREAAQAAGLDGVTVYVNSGWRSSAYQRQLLDEADTRYGTSDSARWVATVATSPHVSGDAVDVGDLDATTWLSEHGAAFGLCQIYANESWHYELRPDAAAHGCPAMYADPSEDPRMQR